MPVKQKRYVVKNPNGLPELQRIIAWDSPDGKAYEWFEGDVFVCPKGLNPERLIRQGYIVEE